MQESLQVLALRALYQQLRAGMTGAARQCGGHHAEDLHGMLQCDRSVPRPIEERIYIRILPAFGAQDRKSTRLNSSH